MSEKGTVILVCAGGMPGASGVYVYDLYNGKLITAFEDPMLVIDDYEFSGDGNRVIFEYLIPQYPPPKDPRTNFVCIDATGELLWNLKMERMSRFFVSYNGDRILYRTARPGELLKKKSYPQLGLMDGNGRVLWEVDQTYEALAHILPSGKYYRVPLYADQSRVWEPTTKQEPLYICVFETLTHNEVQRRTLDAPRLPPREEWVSIDSDGTNWPDGWQVLAFGEKGYQQKESGPVRSLLVIKKYRAREIIYQKEFTGLIVKVLASQDLKVVQVIFWDGRWMLFERIP